MRNSQAAVGPEAAVPPGWTWVAVAFLIALVFAVGFDQGQILRPVLGKAAGGNYLHELFHDGRHLFGFPCH